MVAAYLGVKPPTKPVNNLSALIADCAAAGATPQKSSLTP